RARDHVLRRRRGGQRRGRDPRGAGGRRRGAGPLRPAGALCPGGGGPAGRSRPPRGAGGGRPPPRPGGVFGGGHRPEVRGALPAGLRPALNSLGIGRLVKTPLLKPAGRLQGWILITLVALAAYLPTLRNGFVWDDDTFLTDNALIKAPDGLRRFWLTTEPPDYWPVTSTTLWAEWRLWGRNATGYHVTNLLLHIAEAGLLWGILRRLRAPGALFAALLFAAHPVNVESVAWIAQRKNLMAMLFALGTVWFFLDAEERPQSRRA